MNVQQLFLCFLLILTAVVCEESNFLEEVEDGDQDTTGLKTKLPLLMRTLRLRTFSVKENGDLGFYPRVQLKQLRMRPFGRRHPAVEHHASGDEGEDTVYSDAVDSVNRRVYRKRSVDPEGEKGEPIPGWKLIGRHRRPNGVFGHRVLPLPVRRGTYTLRRNQLDAGQCSAENNLAFTSCFKDYFGHFAIEFDSKLPSIRTVYEKMQQNIDYNQNQEWHNSFKQCYDPLPTACFESSNFLTIIQEPVEFDIYSAFFTSAEYIYKDKHFQDIIDCFLDSFESLPSILQEDAPEVKDQKCQDAEAKIKQSEALFLTNCKHLEATDDEYKQWFVPFVKRQSIGQYCPRIGPL